MIKRNLGALLLLFVFVFTAGCQAGTSHVLPVPTVRPTEAVPPAAAAAPANTGTNPRA